MLLRLALALGSGPRGLEKLKILLALGSGPGGSCRGGSGPGSSPGGSGPSGSGPGSGPGGSGPDGSGPGGSSPDGSGPVDPALGPAPVDLAPGPARRIQPWRIRPRVRPRQIQPQVLTSNFLLALAPGSGPGLDTGSGTWAGHRVRILGWTLREQDYIFASNFFNNGPILINCISFEGS